MGRTLLDMAKKVMKNRPAVEFFCLKIAHIFVRAEELSSSFKSG